MLNSSLISIPGLEMTLWINYIYRKACIYMGGGYVPFYNQTKSIL